MINYENSADGTSERAVKTEKTDNKTVLKLEETVRYQQLRIDQLEQDLRRLKNELRVAVNSFNLLSKKL